MLDIRIPGHLSDIVCNDIWRERQEERITVIKNLLTIIFSVCKWYRKMCMENTVITFTIYIQTIKQLMLNTYIRSKLEATYTWLEL